jgi:hypothetical protein
MQFTQYDKRIFLAFCAVANESDCRSEVTMAKIAAKIDITRQGIRKYGYANVDEIINALRFYVTQEIQTEFQTFLAHNKSNFIPFFATRILPLIYEKRDYFKVLHGPVADAAYIYFAKDIYIPIFESCLALPKEFENDSEIFADVLIRRITSTITAWLMSPNPENPITFQEKFLFLMSHSASEFVK